MGRKLMLAVTLLLSLVAAQVQLARATTFLRLESSYLGDGWFQYHVTVYNDPFFSAAYFTGFSVGCTNTIAQPEVADWEAVDWSPIYPSWSHTNYPARPNETTFLVRSSEPGYRTVYPTNGPCALVLMSLSFWDFRPSGGVASANVVGYANLPCLVPCPADQADGSPTNMFVDLKLVSDINITRVIQTNSEVHGIEFDWTSESTFVLQGTENFTDWTNITYLWSYPPHTVWTTNQPLNNYGRCFRLELVASSHMTDTDLPPLTQSLTRKLSPASGVPATVYPRVVSCLPKNDKVEVNIETTGSQTCIVQAIDSQQNVILKKRLEVRGKTGTVTFNASKLPSPIFFRVSAR